jgi:hypothetical protein
MIKEIKAILKLYNDNHKIHDISKSMIQLESRNHEILKALKQDVIKNIIAQ